jgi:hypothetical protein
MKIILLAVVLLYLPHYPPLHPQQVSETGRHDADTQGKQDGSPEAMLDPPQDRPFQSPATKEEAKGSHKYALWGWIIQFGLLGATLVIAVFSAVQAVFTAKYLRATTAKERARLRLEVAAPNLIEGANKRWQQMHFKIQFIGSTKAFVSKSGARAFVDASRNIRPDFSRAREIEELPSTIGPETRLGDHAPPEIGILWQFEGTFSTDFGPLDDKDIESIGEEKLFIHFYGFIRYADIYGKQHKTFFQLIYVPKRGMVRNGPKRNNRET